MLEISHDRRRPTLRGLVGQLGVAAVVDPDRLENAWVWQRDRLTRARAIKDVATVAAVVLSIRGECRSTSSMRRNRSIQGRSGIKS